MQPQRARIKAQNIDLQAAYPCPCGRQGRLSPIALTEALGCNDCQRIFVTQQSGQRLAPLASHAPEQRMWYWTGQQWRLDRASLQRRYLILSMILLVLSLLLIFVVWRYVPVSIRSLLRLLAAMVLMATVLCGAWLAYRP
ncbi:MAG: hypothetical protein ACFB0C_09240 [Leptolyngbyaceae cyanobacterium]